MAPDKAKPQGRAMQPGRAAPRTAVGIESRAYRSPAKSPPMTGVAPEPRVAIPSAAD
jgi:hypothetical protein